jgi:NRPS condensation-like uncharacterized protein
MGRHMSKWYKLDNAAKIFPSVTNTKNTSVFRVSVVLTEEVDAEILQKAADAIVGRFPMMTVRLRRGVFWNYLDQNPERLLISEEQQYPCSRINPKENNGFLIKILYYKYRISVEAFHSITDGYGGIEFLKSLLYYYLKFSGRDIDPEDKILLPKDGVHVSGATDSFRDNYQKKRTIREQKQRKAHIVKGSHFDNFGHNLVHGVVSASALSRIAKQKGVTISSYLIALLMYSIWHTKRKDDTDDGPVIVAVPVNLRKYFPSQTLRNFWSVVNIGGQYNIDTPFDELVTDVARCLKDNTSKEHLSDLIASNIKFENSYFTRLVPLFIKNIFIYFGVDVLGASKKTITLSNLGNIVLPGDMNEFIDQFETVLYPSKKSPINCCICSSDDRMNMTFTRTITDAKVLQYFFSYLSEKEGLDVEIYSNDWGKYYG